MSELVGALTPKTATDPIVDQLVEEFARRVQSGSPVDIEEFASQHPEQAAQLRRILPALQVLADLDCTAERGPGSGLVRAAMEPLGDFRLVREIGRGGMGIVYEAEQMSLGRCVALKILPFAATMDARQLQRFQNEVRAAASLKHPHIVPVYAVGCERGVHYYAMQFVEGQSLEAVIRGLKAEQQTQESENSGESGALSPSPPYRGEGSKPVAAETVQPGPHTLRSTMQTDRDRFRRIAEWGTQAAKALEHAHGTGMVHRDIKPANLLVDIQGQLWVTDFGLARTAANPGLTMTGDVIGTLRYMSPEQALAKHGLVDHRTDIYALGATLYELLTLRPAVDGKDREEILRNLALDEPKNPRSLNRSIPTDLETIVLKALAKEPADRYGLAQELAEDLERFVKDEPIRARRPSLRRRLAQWRRRHRALVIGVAVCQVTVLLLGGAALWSREQENAATAAAVAKDLELADEFQKQQQWAKALQALGHASGQLRGRSLKSLQDKVDRRHREVHLVAKLEQAQLLAATFRVELQEVKGGKPRAEQALTAVFSEHGLDVTRPAQEVADQIRLSAICTQLVVALEHWATLRDTWPGHNGESLRAIAELADNDPWRQRVRAARAAKDFEELVRLAEEENALDQPPASLLLLSQLLDNAPAPAGTKAAETRHGERLLRRAWQRYPSDFWINYSLSRSLWLATMLGSPESVGFLRAAVALQPRNDFVYWLLGLELRDLKNWSEAAEALQRSAEIDPNNSEAYYWLGRTLEDQNKVAEAEAVYHKTLKLRPNDAGASQRLADIFLKKGKHREAEEILTKVTVRQPRDSGAFNWLGVAFSEQNKLAQAEAAYREALKLQPTNDDAYHNLGALRQRQGRLPEAEEFLSKAIELQLERVQKLPERLMAWARNERYPQLALSYYSLGTVLAEQHKIPEAEAACRKAIEFNPDLAEAHHNLGYALAMQKKPADAERALRTAIKFKPDFAQAHYNLGLALRQQGKLGESLASLQRAHALGYQGTDWSLPAAQDVHRAEQLVALDAKLPSLLNGATQPTDSAERLALGELCQLPCRQLYAAAVRFYSEAFTDPKLAGDLRAASRYQAALAAALAGRGHGKDAATADATKYARLREQARAWLEADLACWRALLQNEPDKARRVVRKRLRHWQHELDLVSVRSAEALAKLPESERHDWKRFWHEVEKLQREAGEPMMRVRSTSPAANGTILLTEPALRVHFSEPYDPKTVNTGNLTLNGGKVSGFSMSADHTSVTYALAGLAQGRLKVSISAGALADPSGNGMLGYSASYFVNAGLERPGALDTTFNSTGPVPGLVTGPIEVPSGDGTHHPGIVMQADGKIVAGGFVVGANGHKNFALARYNANGSLDTTFGSNQNGVVTTVLGARNSWINGLALDSNGNVVAVGRATRQVKKGNVSLYYSAFAVARYRPTGTLDASFGSGGTVLTPMSDIEAEPVGASAVAIREGHIYVAGTAEEGSVSPSYQFAVIRYTPTGSLDAGFGKNGIVITPQFGSGPNLVNALAVQPDGKIVLVGSAGPAIALARYTASGNLDPSFSGKGAVTLPFLGTRALAHGVVIQDSGAIVVAGLTTMGALGSNNTRLTLARLTSAGQLDTAFGKEGFVIDDKPGSAWAMAQAANGTLLACGTVANEPSNWTSFKMLLQAYFPDGTVDQSFGTDGMASIGAAGINDRGRALAIQPDGKIVALGFTPLGRNNFTIALARFHYRNGSSR